MKLRYFVAGKVIEIELRWFTHESINKRYEVRTAIEQCAKHYYEIEDGECNFPIEIALCVDNKEIGRETVGLDFDPIFQCV